MMKSNIDEAFEKLVQKKDEFIISKLKELINTGVLWVETYGCKVNYIDELKQIVELKQDMRFCFDTIRPLDKLKDENKKLRELMKEVIESEGHHGIQEMVDYLK